MAGNNKYDEFLIPDRQGNLTFKNFDINEGTSASIQRVSPTGEVLVESGTYRLPSAVDHTVWSPQEYADSFKAAGIAYGGIKFLAKDAMSLPPSTQSFARISYMPNNSTSELGILQWPGLPPETLEKLSKEMVGLQMVLSTRCTDILRFAEISDKPWRPGWNIRPADTKQKLNSTILAEIREAEQFLSNSGYGAPFNDPLMRDQLLRPSFSKFLLEITRDSLIFDGIAIWTQMDGRGRIKSFAPLPAKQIRLLARADRAQITQAQQGELNFYGATSMAGKQPSLTEDNMPFAVVVDETNNPVKSFTREELIWYTRNPRINPEIGGYGYPEPEMALMLITGVNNAIQFNADLFDKNSIPKALLAIKGNFTQRQFDALNRIWDNLQRGNRTDWTLPAIQLSEKGEIQLISFEPLRSETAYYANLINLFMGALCTIYAIPTHRLGYKISGTERDSRPDTPKSLQEEEDMGLPALLGHLEILINDYLIKNRWPHLRFSFTGKTPKEDARLYEVNLLTKTADERRQMVGDPPFESTLPKDATEMEVLIARLMGMSPVDPIGATIYQGLIASMAKAGMFNALLGLPMPGGGGGEGGKGGGTGQSGLGNIQGANFKPKKDPAVSEQHGHTSGVRRTSHTQGNNKPQGNNPPNLRRVTQSYSQPDTGSYSGTRGSNT
jgi:hypothetical protein